MGKVTPIKPSEIGQGKADVFPDAVFEAFNQLIAEQFSQGCATIKQDDVVALMEQKGLGQAEIQRKGWLNVEDAYRAAGWAVEYDKPGYNESGPATFTFRRAPGR